MKNWDLTSGAAKMGLALDSLMAISVDTEQYWNDAARSQFQETYIEPLDPKVKALLDAIRRLAEVLGNADRQCGIESREY